ncbi:hypothetical protein AGMMS50256_10520 [Betaproteobacteria bacterium]|nr:hypothetical protein AGMMS50256_10520 [Betaproteobacteria bacterium]
MAIHLKAGPGIPHPPLRGTLSRKRARGMLSLRPACGEKVAEGRMRGWRLCTKQRWNRPGHPLTRPYRGTLSRKRARESKRLFMLYHDKYIHAIALSPLGFYRRLRLY